MLVSVEKNAVIVSNIGAGVSFCTGAYPEELLFCMRLKHLVAIEDWKSQSIQQFCVDGKVKINKNISNLPRTPNKLRFQLNVNSSL